MECGDRTNIKKYILSVAGTYPFRTRFGLEVGQCPWPFDGPLEANNHAIGRSRLKDIVAALTWEKLPGSVETQNQGFQLKNPKIKPLQASKLLKGV